MIDQKHLEKLVDEIVARQGAFLVDLAVDAGNQIRVKVDHVKGITLQQLAEVSRAIEQGFDREEEDFEITVTSPGVGAPLQVPQQYEQNLGRKVLVKTRSGEEYKGRLTAFDADELTVQWKERQPKEKGKGKVTVEKEQKIALAEVDQTKVQIEFK